MCICFYMGVHSLLLFSYSGVHHCLNILSSGRQCKSLYAIRCHKSKYMYMQTHKVPSISFFLFSLLMFSLFGCCYYSIQLLYNAIRDFLSLAMQFSLYAFGMVLFSSHNIDISCYMYECVCVCVFVCSYEFCV